jgi:poly-gamma-glutamate capsule biosynthesis protein CapA/YwtB (metallophosphatase superfamily)
MDFFCHEVLPNCLFFSFDMHCFILLRQYKKEKQGDTSSRDTLRIAAVGDIMLGTSYPSPYSLPPNNGKKSFKAALQHLQQADVTFGNLEGTLLDGGAPSYGKLHLTSKAYLFRMPKKYGEILKDAGFDVMSLANNHVGDFGDAGRKSTVNALDSLNIQHAGQQSHPFATFTINGTKYGFCAFAPNINTVSIHDLKRAAAIIKNLKQSCDIVIVSFHGGGEGVNFEHVPFKAELFLSERRGDVHAFAHNAVDAGADLVFGHGPHVIRAIEKYNNRIIAYSLGNFCTYKNISISGISGLAPLLKVQVNKKGEFLSGQIISFRQNHANGLVLDTLHRAAKRIKSLTKTDFPHTGLTISDKGLILNADVNPPVTLAGN